jgi:spore maturation protein CgeB
VSYSSNLRKLGHEAQQIFFNNEDLQMAWAREHGLKINTRGHTRWQFRLRRGLVPWLSRSKDRPWLYDILTAQIQHYKPDVLLNNEMRLSTAYFRHMKPYVRLLVGSHGSPLPEDRDFGVYDLVLSVVENFVDCFRQEGVNSELLRLGFEPLVLDRLHGTERSIPVSFVGQLTRDHASRQHWLEYLCERIPVHVWAPSTNGLRDDSPVIRCHQGTVWGTEMYEILHKSLITLNHHIDVAGAYAGNGRLFEATGMGTLLVTDWKTNLHEMFELGKEVVAYRSAEECAEMVRYYLEHDEEREAIARAGQQRTLRDHTYYQRMQEFADIVRKYL